jgi:hypothetical protein
VPSLDKSGHRMEGKIERKILLIILNIISGKYKKDAN